MKPWTRPRSATASPSHRWPAVAAGGLWLAAGLSLGYWALQVLGRSPVVPLAAVPSPPLRTEVASVARALGMPAAASSPQAGVASVEGASRWRLLGVVVRPGQQGVALLALDGQPPRPYAVGAVLEGGLVLQAVTRQGARLGPQRQGPATVELGLAVASPAATPGAPPPAEKPGAGADRPQ